MLQSIAHKENETTIFYTHNNMFDKQNRVADILSFFIKITNVYVVVK